MPFAGFLLSAVATSILLAWVFNHAAGSVLLAGLMHSVVDASIVFAGVMSSGATLLWLFVAVQWRTALGDRSSRRSGVAGVSVGLNQPERANQAAG